LNLSRIRNWQGQQLWLAASVLTALMELGLAFMLFYWLLV
jgi:hypothetical protein